MNVRIKFTWHSVVQPIVDYMMKMMLFVDHEFHPIPYQVDMIVHYIMMMVFVFYCYLLHVHLYITKKKNETNKQNKYNVLFIKTTTTKKKVNDAPIIIITICPA